MKKIITFIILLFIVFFVIFKVTKPGTKITYLIDTENYKDIVVNNIKEISIGRYTEGGLTTEYVKDKDEIRALYNKLSDIKIGKETNMACEDNTTVYNITLKDSKTKSIVIECDWILIGDKRYMIEK